MGSFWLSVLAEILASVPVFGAGLWVSHRALRRHVDAKTDQQTAVIEDLTGEQTTVIRGITDEQTAELLGRTQGSGGSP